MNKKTKCEKCKRCKAITQYDIVICDYLNELRKTLTNQMFFCRPRYCDGFVKKGKGGADNA